MTEKPLSPDFPESASIEYIDNFGNHRQILWYPVTYYRYEDRLLGVPGSDVPLSGEGDKSPKMMKKRYEWLLDNAKKSERVISSTIQAIPAHKKKGKNGRSKKRKREKE